jgi:hypothetical protein
MTLTDVANLALSALGEPLLTDYATDNGTTAAAVRLHLPIARDTLIEGHVWSFATKCSRLTAVPVVETSATLTTGAEGDNNAILWTAVAAGPSGNEISVEIAEADETTDEIAIAVSLNAITVTPPGFPSTITNSGSLTIDGTPYLLTEMVLQEGLLAGKPYYRQEFGPEDMCDVFWNGSQWFISSGHPTANWYSTDDVLSPDLVTTWNATAPAAGTPDFAGTIANTAADIIAATTADFAASLLVTAENYGASDGTGVVATVAATNLSGGTSTSTVFAPAYGSAFNLPDDCLRVIQIDTTDLDAPLNQWEIQGRHLLLPGENEDAPVIHYLSNSADVSTWPVTFADAVAYLLAHRLAPLLSDDQNLAAGLLNRSQIALGQARSRDARETRSKENHGPRALAARSGLVTSRFGSTAPPYGGASLPAIAEDS